MPQRARSHRRGLLVKASAWLGRAVRASGADAESLLDRASRLAGVGGWAFDLSTRRVHWSDQACRIHDIEPPHEPTFERALAFFFEDGQRQLIEALDRMSGADAKARWELELPLTTALGRFIWVRIVGEVVATARNGRPTRLAGSIEDITARRALEQATLRSNTVLRSVVENLPCGVSVYDADQKLITENRLFRRLLDLPDSLFENGGLTFRELIEFNRRRGDYGRGEKGERVVQQFLDYARAPSEIAFERQHAGMAMEVRAAPMPGGGFITIYIDLTERKRADAAIARTEQLLRDAMDAIDESFVLFDPDDRLVFCNETYRATFADIADLLQPGVTYEQILRARIARNPAHESRSRPDGIEGWLAERLALHRRGETRLVQRLADGRSLRIVERKMADGHIAGFRVDITDLLRATEAAEKASIAKSQFLANTSHEIRTPMTAVLGMLKLLQKTALTPRQRDYVAKTEGAARSLLGLLNDILDFSKVEAGKMSLDPHPMRTDELLRDLSVILAANVGRKNVEVLFDVDPALPRVVLADAMRMQQVLINLAGNAIKFTERGEVVVQLKVVERDKDGVTLDIAVRDTGIGIAPEHQQHIFSGFTQAEASTSRRFGGTGLGLAISQRLVQLMGSELKLESAPGHGSRFHFRLRLGVPPGAVPVLRYREGPGAGQVLRALLVDDNAAARDTLASMGRSLGWQIDTAASGEQALALVQAAGNAGRPYEVVLVDWQMPGMDGWQTSQGIRALGADAQTPLLVMVTAHGREMLAQRSEQEQGLLDGFLVKPVTASMLYDAVVDARSGAGASKPMPLPDQPAQRRLAGLRLLVVEDNLNNQQVARELLVDEGAEVLLAGDGQQALSLLAHAKHGESVDAVLMDVQMPVMDGYTATRLIRRQLGLTLPIIAMTANALPADAQVCLDAGMTEHVGKPFDLDHLVAVLLRLCGAPAPPVAAEATPPGRPVHSARPPLELAPELLERARLAGIELAEALARMSGKCELFERTVGALADHAATLPDRLDGRPVEAAAALHGLRGLAATVGATALAALAAEGEHAYQDGAQPPPEWRPRFENVLLRDLAALGELAHGLPEQQSTTAMPLDMLIPGPDATIGASLRALTELIDGSDLDALQAFENLRPALQALRPDETAALTEALARLDLETSARLCRRLSRELAP